MAFRGGNGGVPLQKGTINRRLRGSVGMLDDANPTRLSKQSQAVPLHSSSPWTRWLSLDQKGSVRVQIPCEEVFQCQAKMEAIGWWSEHDCCAGTPPWVGGCTSCLAVCSQRARGTDLTLDWCTPSICQFEDAMLWKTPTLSLVSDRVLWWNTLWIEVHGPRLRTSEGHGASRLDVGRAWLLLSPPLCASEWSVLVSTLSPPLSSLRRDQRRGGVLWWSPH